MITDPHTQVVLDRYADRSSSGFVQSPTRQLVERYLGKLMNPAEFKGKSVLEIGAGWSHYTAVFLENGCTTYYANDLICERLQASRVADPRYVSLPGDFRGVNIAERVDFVFACLTMMFVQPMLGEFIEKIRDCLKPGGHFVSMDPNYLCPLAFVRRFTDLKPNPARLFNPFRYAQAFSRQGFVVEKLVPFTAPMPWTTGNWLLGTNFWLTARKP